MPENTKRCHYAWLSEHFGWVRCQHDKGVGHGERHEWASPEGNSFVVVVFELDYQPHRWVS
jgi:hypothetical protein